MTLIDDNVSETNPTATLTDATAAPPASPSATPAAGSNGMRVRKRSGALEPVDVNKIVNAIARAITRWTPKTASRTSSCRRRSWEL